MNTLYYYEVSQKGFTKTMNELGLSAFVMGARVRFDPDILIDNMKELIKTAGRNFLIVDGHHCAEKTALIETINSMRLQTVDGIMYLFPCWPDREASFTRLRAKGAFLVSARFNGKNVSELSIFSENGGECRINDCWPGTKIQVSENGRPVSLKKKGSVYSFSTNAGGCYQITPSGHTDAD